MGNCNQVLFWIVAQSTVSWGNFLFKLGDVRINTMYSSYKNQTEKRIRGETYSQSYRCLAEKRSVLRENILQHMMVVQNKGPFLSPKRTSLKSNVNQPKRGVCGSSFFVPFWARIFEQPSYDGFSKMGNQQLINKWSWGLTLILSLLFWESFISSFVLWFYSHRHNCRIWILFIFSFICNCFAQNPYSIIV